MSSLRDASYSLLSLPLATAPISGNWACHTKSASVPLSHQHLSDLWEDHGRKQLVKQVIVGAAHTLNQPHAHLLTYFARACLHVPRSAWPH